MEGISSTVFETPLSRFVNSLVSVGEVDSGPSSTVEPTSRYTCHACEAVFSSRDDQAIHYRTGLHSENLRRRLLGQLPLRSSLLHDKTAGADAADPGVTTVAAVDEDENEEEDGEDDDDDDDDDEEEEEEDGGGVVVNEEEFFDDNDYIHHYEARVAADEGGDSSSAHIHTCRWWWLKSDEPVVCIASRDKGSQHGIELSIALVTQSRRALVRGGSAELLSGLVELAESPLPKWAVLLLRSGRFAGGLFEGGKLVEHQTFKRYTVRKGQGGSQASIDGTGKKPKSAGAMLRRHGEQALSADVRNLIGTTWAHRLAACNLVFISVPRTLRSVLFGGENAPLDTGDRRIRSIPFMVPKPSLAEVKRVHVKLAKLKIIQIKEVRIKPLALLRHWRRSSRPAPLLLYKADIFKR